MRTTHLLTFQLRWALSNALGLHIFHALSPSSSGIAVQQSYREAASPMSFVKETLAGCDQQQADGVVVTERRPANIKLPSGPRNNAKVEDGLCAPLSISHSCLLFPVL